MYSRTLLNDIRDRVSIAALIGERLPLKRAGRNLVGLCPFHNEKTPSFNVSDEKGIYHCFGCGEGGDVFQFLMKFEGLPFAEAVEQLAARAGVTLPKEEDPRARAAEEEAAHRRKKLIKINAIARDFFAGLLLDSKRGEAARSYLAKRGLAPENFTQHFLGYADNGWDALTRHLESKGVPLPLAAELGLVKARDGGGYYDFFRHRIIFPILSPRGEVIGFGGRALDGAVGGETSAKYLNSPDSSLYHKSNCVYGLDRSAAAIRAADQVILVEGYMDFIALHQAGIANVAAPLGTALTSGHLAAIGRLTRTMVLLFDGDEAGSRAAMRALPLFLDAGIMPRVVRLPSGEDPDTFVRKAGADELRARIASAVPLFDAVVEAIVASTGLDSAGKIAAMQRVAPLLKRTTDPYERSVLEQSVARRLDVDAASVAKAVGKPSAPERAAARPGPRNAAAGEGADGRAERLLVAAMLAHPATIPAAFEAVGPAHFSDEWCRMVASLLLEAWRDAETVNVGGVIEALEDEALATELRAIAIEGGQSDEEEAQRLVEDLAGRLRERPARTRLEALNDEIRRAERDGDDTRLLALLAEKKELSGQVHGKAATRNS